MSAAPASPTIATGRLVDVTLRMDAALPTLARLWRDFPAQAPRAIMRALNSAGVLTRKLALQAVTNELNILRRDAAKSITLYKADARRPDEADVRIAGELTTTGGGKAKAGRIALSRFHPRQKRNWVGTSYAIRRGSPKMIPHAFVQTMPSGHVGVFIRTKYLQAALAAGAQPAKGKGKFVELFGPSIPHVAEKSPALERGFRVDVSARFAQALESQLDLLSGRRKTPAPSAGGSDGE